MSLFLSQKQMGKIDLAHFLTSLLPARLDTFAFFVDKINAVICYDHGRAIDEAGGVIVF